MSRAVRIVAAALLATAAAVASPGVSGEVSGAIILAGGIAYALLRRDPSAPRGTAVTRAPEPAGTPARHPIPGHVPGDTQAFDGPVARGQAEPGRHVKIPKKGTTDV